ncbi:hypothetical protein [Candidatus Deianiraea vastatrix]|uniref:Transposase n=1 Tax=Candidatus Deianiraea vastatrix TaxID=2163644 RepID=A0A5B8XDP2_9RICK|nr:hypothetical protein [Candidatus Deianiraea vastatrix]QED22995.1 hypothetical protein Deia_00187 [Candidatus Deianiraea vastatrix]
MSELIKTHLGKKELDRQAISKIANLLTLLIKEDREQQKQSNSHRKLKQNQSNDLCSSYEKQSTKSKSK